MKNLTEKEKTKLFETLNKMMYVSEDIPYDKLDTDFQEELDVITNKLSKLRAFVSNNVKKYKVFWLDNKTEIIEGYNITDAFNRAGYGGGAFRALDYYEEIG